MPDASKSKHLRSQTAHSARIGSIEQSGALSKRNRTLRTLATEIKWEHQQHLATVRRSLEHAIAAGKKLLHTPRLYVEAARRVLGTIDLDPASCAEVNKVERATKFFTKDDDGLKQPWHGNALLNPPYKREVRDFVVKLVVECRSGNVSAAILLVNAYSTDAEWFAPLWDALLCFTDHRVDLTGTGPRTTAPTIQSLTLLRNKGGKTMSIANELSELWTKPMSDDACYVYLNPKAPQPVKDFVAEYFSFATRVSAIFMQERTGGFTDDGPALADYSAAILLENGELQLLKPCIPAADFDDPDCELTDCQRNDDKEQEALTMRIRVIKRSKFLKLLDRSGDRDAECLATIISRLQNLGHADRPDCLMCEETLADYAAVGAIIMVHVKGGVMPSTLCHRCAGRYDSEITAAILQRLNK